MNLTFEKFRMVYSARVTFENLCVFWCITVTFENLGECVGHYFHS